MRKQNVINKLAFNKADVAELNENQLQYVNGGTSVPNIFNHISLILIPVEVLD